MIIKLVCLIGLQPVLLTLVARVSTGMISQADLHTPCSGRVETFTPPPSRHFIGFFFFFSVSFNA